MRIYPEIGVESNFKNYKFKIHFADYLMAKNHIARTSLEIIKNLRMIRNKVVHDYDVIITKKEVYEFLKTSMKIFTKLESISK